jgi:DNA polymerase-3 subunit delta'
MVFRDLIAHRSLAEGLLRSRAEGRLPHALLFLGPGGNGALPLAWALATCLHCEQPQADDACGTCPSCRQAARAMHPDIHFSYPLITVGSGSRSQQKHKATDYIAEWRQFLDNQPYGVYEDWMALLDDSAEGTGNKQGNIPKDEVLDIQRKLNLKTFGQGYKVLILWLPEYLGNEGNRLLKLIEEPPDRTLFILVAEDAERILPTMLSRTQIVRVPRLAQTDLEQALISRRGITPEEAGQIASRSEGSYRDALLLAEGGLSDTQALFDPWLQMASRWEVLRLYTWLDEFQKLSREKQKHFFAYALNRVRELWLCSLGAALPARSNDAVLAAVLSPSGWETLAADLEKSAYYLSRNAHARLVMLNCSVRFSRSVQEHDLAQRGAASSVPPSTPRS